MTGNAMTTAVNPLLPGCYPDPTICRVGEDYYLVTSTFEYFPGLPIFHSRDLVNWEQIGHIVDRDDQLNYHGIASSGGLYAPTLRHHDGMFWVVCTMVGSTVPGQDGNFIMTATDPAGPWSAPVWLNVAGIDPSIFFDDDGRIWMHGTRLVEEPEWHDQTEVWVRELDRSAMTLIGEEHVIWNGALRDVVWAEGPHLYKVNGSYYLLAAEGGTEFHHAISVAKAAAVTGPYVGNKGNPVLTHRHLGKGSEVVGVGHADLVHAVDGSWWAVLLAMRPYGGYHYNLGRETFLVKVIWEDGWPVFAPGVGQVENEIEIPWEATGRLGVTQGQCSGVVKPDDPRWTALRGPASRFAAPNGDGWELTMLPATLIEPGTPAFLGIRQQHQDIDVTVAFRSALADGEEFGMVVRQSEGDHGRLFVTNNNGGRLVTAVHRRSGIDETLGELRIPADSKEQVRLVLRARAQDYSLLVVDSSGRSVTVAVLDGGSLDSVATGGFLGLWIGAYATSNGRPTATRSKFTMEYTPVRA